MLKHRVSNVSAQNAARVNRDVANTITGHYTDFPSPPEEFQRNINAHDTDQDSRTQSFIPYASPKKVILNNDSALSGEQYNAPETLQNSNSFSGLDAKEGIRLITEKYDSIGNLSASPQKSPLGSPCSEEALSSDGSRFSFTDMVMAQKYREGVTEQDLLQVDTFYRSHKSEVHVCACLANMYFGSIKSALNHDQWTFSSTGIPLLLLDTGEHHRERKLTFILAEKGTGFTLWRDVIDSRTGYKTPNANFHTMYLSKDHTQLAGFSFDDAGAASEFYGHIRKLTADPDDELLQVGKLKKKKSIRDKKKKVKLPKKTEISQPCCFVHVTKLDRSVNESSSVDTKTENTPTNPNEISPPFNFQHVTGPSGTGNDVDDVSNLVGSNNALRC